MKKQFPTPDIWLPHRVSYGETDTMGFVYYAEYLHFFERARSEYIREILDMSYVDIEHKGILLPVREAYCRYRHPAHYDDLIQIRTALSEIGHASMTFVYFVTDNDRTTILAEGQTQHATINPDGKLVRLPEWLSTKLKKGKN